MDAFQVLGLAPTATLDEAENAYYRLLRQHHPDLHHGGTTDEIADAEQRTRELNSAIEFLRTQASVSAGAQGFGAAGAQPSGWQPGADPGDAWGTWWGTDDRAAWSRSDMRPTVHCPTCGIELSTVAEFKAHVEMAHNLLVTKRTRRRRARRAKHRTPASLWALAPGNILAALAVSATVDSMLHDGSVAVWAFCVTMAPTAIRLVNGR